MHIEDWMDQLVIVGPGSPDPAVRAEWERRTRAVCKPCWELKYCPYGPLVELFPFPPPTEEEMQQQHIEYLRQCLITGEMGDGQPLDEALRRQIEDEIEHELEPRATHGSPTASSHLQDDVACAIFGHLCPVHFVAEDMGESGQARRSGRRIPFRTKMRVARRDNYTCQVCGRLLLDRELEYDHIIPLSRGGSSEEHNIRVTCSTCNRKKGKHTAP